MLARIAQSPTECDSEVEVGHVAALLAEKRAHCAIVTNSGRMIGVVTTKDLAFRVTAAGRGGDTRVGDVMSPNPVFVHVSTSPNDALMLMVRKRVRHLPLVEAGGHVVGVLDITACFYEALIKMERLSSQVQGLQSAVEGLEGTAEVFALSGTSAMGARQGSSHSSGGPGTSPSGVDGSALEFSSYSFVDTEPRQTIVRDIRALVETLKQPTIGSLLAECGSNAKAFYVDPKTDLATAAQVMAHNNLTATLIVDGASAKSNNEPLAAPHLVGNVIGILTTKDIAFRVLSIGLDPGETKVARVMTSRPHFANEETVIHSALRLMYEGKYLNLPIANAGGQVLGVVNVLSLTRAMLRTLETTFIKSEEVSEYNVHALEGLELGRRKTAPTTGPAWDQFWGSLEPPSIRKYSSSRRSSSLAFQSERLSSIESGENKRVTLKLQVQEPEGPVVGANGKMFRFSLSMTHDTDVHALVMGKLEKRLPGLTNPNILCELGYYDTVGDFISVRRAEDLELGITETLVCKATLLMSSSAAPSSGKTIHNSPTEGDVDVTSGAETSGVHNSSFFFLLGFIVICAAIKFAGPKH